MSGSRGGGVGIPGNGSAAGVRTGTGGAPASVTGLDARADMAQCYPPRAATRRRRATSLWTTPAPASAMVLICAGGMVTLLLRRSGAPRSPLNPWTPG